MRIFRVLENHTRKIKIAGASVAVLLLALMLHSNEPSIGDTPPQFMRIEGKLIAFSDERQARHIDTDLSFPKHEDVLPGPPLNVVVNFDTPLTAGSLITARANNADYGDGETVIDPDKRTMRRVVKSDAPDGVYAVNYDACFEDGKCRKGAFSFAVNRAKAQTYDDLRNKNEVLVAIDGGGFDHARIRVSRGTTVVWKNTDDELHAIRTEPHPAHTYFEGLASPPLQPDESYSFTFWIPGVYPFHSDTDPKAIAGAVVVE